jgi:biopolymer transport protein ExbD
MNFRRRRKGHQELHAGALNDILFILLFFFLIVSTLANPNVIKLSQPRAKSDTKAKQKQITIEEMKAFITPYVQKDSTQATIAINADKTVPLENVVAVMRVARDLGARSTLLVDTKTP